MKRVFLLVILISSLFSISCVAVHNNGSTTYDRIGNFDNRFMHMYADVVETDNAIYFHKTQLKGALLYYFDKESGISDVLCSKPECTHDNPGCNALIDSINCNSLSYYEGKLWYVGVLKPNEAVVYSLLPDGSEKREETKIQLPDNCNPQNIAVVGGRIYISSCSHTVLSGAPKYVYKLIVAGIHDTSCDTVFERITAANGIPQFHIRFTQNAVYCCIGSFSSKSEVLRWAPGMDGPEQIIGAEEGYCVQDFWVNDDGACFFSAISDDLEAVFCVEHGKQTSVIDFRSDNESFGMLRVSDGVVVALGASDTESSLIWIKDFDGNTLYKGKFEKYFAHDPDRIMIGGIGGDRNCIYFLYTEEDESFAGNVSERDLLVRYKIVNSELKETVICEQDWI